MIKEAAGAIGRLDGAAVATIGRMADLLIATFDAGGRVYVCGNGGSAADAQHIAGELAGRFRRQRRPLPCVALSTDTSVLTSVANDYSYEDVFSRQVEALAASGDVLWALSTSGNSPNVLKAAAVARAAGAKVIAMTGSGGGALAEAADLCFRAPADRTDLIQLLHQLAYHIICELLDERFSP
ncbi:MAG TPA: SIS domain-containing protein [Phycisphaerae bacterium]|nr:SIS domain-containing protein [Phycisphaerae bacterium]